MNQYFQILKRAFWVCILCLFALNVSACQTASEDNSYTESTKEVSCESADGTNAERSTEGLDNEEATIANLQNEGASLEKETEDSEAERETLTEATGSDGQEKILEINLEEDFAGLNGAAVFYRPEKQEYYIYNPFLADTKRSPCSTFKIVSSLLGMEYGVLTPENSMREWSGEIFWNEDWNRDIDFEAAFRTSCVWYFRQLIDEIGPENMAEGLEKLDYGNQDVSDWAGKLNNNNNNPALTGFWIESSLKISPKEQTEVMERIFGKNSPYSAESVEALKRVMKMEETEESGVSIYGKTGLGKQSGITVDAWYTGFAEVDGENIYFCIYLGQTDGMDVSSTKAKEIAKNIILREA